MEVYVYEGAFAVCGARAAGARVQPGRYRHGSIGRLHGGELRGAQALRRNGER